MKKVIFVLLVCLFVCVGASAQTAPADAAAQPAADAKPKRQIFRANKDQIKEVQTMLKTKGTYTGEATGKMDVATRTAIKSFQKDNGLRETGTLNRATLEKMGVELTDKQKLIPVSPNSYASADTGSTKPKRVIFRASKDQITEAQRILKAKSMYSGEETGKLDDATREGLKKFQEANGIKVTGTLNRATIEKLGIELTDKQKEAASAGNK